MQNDRKIGNIYEDMACNYLKQQGVLILQRNFHIRQGEIDIVGSKDDVLLFIEVKYRKMLPKDYLRKQWDEINKGRLAELPCFIIRFTIFR